ncbi:MAG: hypothetical protein HQ592_11915 [Planctomycetes bacterium]|nr:hypothetical protein [Planctomycetota bacterium]
MAGMTDKERLLGTLRFEKVDRAPDLEFFAWNQTIERWAEEGMEGYTGFDNYLGTDEVGWGPHPMVGVEMHPSFEEEVLEDKGDHLIVRDHEGAVCEKSKTHASIPRYIKFAIETRADWEKFAAERLDPKSPGRVPENIDEICAQCGDGRTTPVLVFGASLYGKLRNWMGVENLSMALYDDFAWIEEMMEHLTRLCLEVYESIAGKCTVDYAIWWEDMCYRSGPLISPEMFARLMVPRYRRMTDFLRNELGCHFNMLDCDGNIHELVGLWLEGGINLMFPLEAAHTDPYRISKEFGTRVPLRGGFDKRAQAAGPEAIDAEFERLRPLFEKGGFIPHTDHAVPADVSFENYLYYRRKKCEFIGKEWIDPREK